MKTIPLTQGKVALVDDEDFEFVCQFNWQARFYNGLWHARRRASAQERRDGASDRIWLHRILMDAPANKEVDHKNGDGLDCQRENMRLATHGQNMRNSRLSRNNTSGYKGVRRASKSTRWIAQIKLNDKQVYIGCFRDPLTAAQAYDAKARELHGEFARLNFPTE